MFSAEANVLAHQSSRAVSLNVDFTPLDYSLSQDVSVGVRLVSYFVKPGPA